MEQLVEDVSHFRRHASRCRKVFETHGALFHRDPKATELLRRVAPNFFYDISDWLADYHVVLAARLTDRELSQGRSNLTSAYLMARLKEKSLLTPEIERLGAALNAYRDRVVGWRNRKVVHIDRDEAMNPPQQSDHAYEEVVGFHEHLDNFCLRIAEATGAPHPTTIRVAQGPGGVSSFLMKMKRAFGGAS